MLFKFFKNLFRPSNHSNNNDDILSIDMLCELDIWLYNKQARYTETNSDWDDGLVHTEGII